MGIFRFKHKEVPGPQGAPLPEQGASWSAGRIFWLALLCLIAYNARRLWDPPYWDGVVGLFAQASWLKDHGFDFMALWRQPHLMDGGPRNCILYIMAPLIAVLLDLISPGPTFFLLHVLNLVCAAAVLALCYVMLCRVLPRSYALSWCAAAALVPIFSGQSARIYLEIPQATAYAAAVYCIQRRRHAGAAVFCILAYLVKPSAIILGIALFVWFFADLALQRFVVEKRPISAFSSRKSYALLIPLPLFVFLERWATTDMQTLAWRPLHKLLLSYLTSPVLFLLSVAGFLLLLSQLAWPRGRSRLVKNPEVLGLVLFLSLLVFGYWSAFFLFHNPLCRYITAYIVPLAVLLGLLLHAAIGRASVLAALAWMILNVFNQYGAILPSPPFIMDRTGAILERSREHLKSLDVNLVIARMLERDHFDDTIVCKEPWVQMLTMPDLGYVRRGLPNVYAAGGTPGYTNAGPLYARVMQDPDTLYLYSPNSLEDRWLPSLRPCVEDQIVLLDKSFPGPPFVVYKREDGPWTNDRCKEEEKTGSSPIIFSQGRPRMLRRAGLHGPGILPRL